MTKKLNIFIADDDDFFRNAIELLIQGEQDMEVVGSAANGLEVIEKLREDITLPDIVLIDIKMPRMNGIECIQQLRQRHPDLLLIILTTFNEEEFIIEGLISGANGYVIKGIDFRLLLQTIRDLSKGQYILPIEVATKLATYTMEKLGIAKHKVIPSWIQSGTSFTVREQELIQLLLQRYSNREMARKLHLNEGTLRNYLSTLYNKLEVRNRYEAIAKLTEPAE